ncbi:restriction endonuclease subunit S [Methanogenium cariaci]|jgi:type I restriction enzyme, S subunit
MQQTSEVPEGWVKTPLASCVDILDNQRVPINSKERETRIGNIPYYGATCQVGWIDDFLFDEELLLIGEDGAPFFDKTKQIAYIIQGKSWVNNHAHVIRAIEELTSNKFLKYYLDCFDFNGYVTGTTRYKLNQGSMKKILIHLPPLTEQHRIVVAIEALFARLDAAEARLERVPGIVHQFRQSVLAAACDGRLTEGWRADNPEIESAKELFGRIKEEKKFLTTKGIIKRQKEQDPISLNEFPYSIPHNWMWARWCEISKNIADIDHKMPNECKEGIPYVSPKNFIKNNKIDFENSKKISIADFNKLKKKIQPEYADIIFPRYGTIGVNRFVDTKIDFLASYSCAVIKNLKNYIHPKYSYYYSISPLVKNEIRKYVNSTTQPNVGLKSIQSFIFPLPPLPEQHEIVRRVDALFACANQIEANVATARDRIAKLRQSILAQAFSGQLVPTEAELARREGREYEPGAVLLEKII